MFDSKNKIKFEIVTQEKVVLKEMILQVTVPTEEGEITVLPNHTPLISNLEPGIIELKKEDKTIEIMSLSGGFIEVLRNKIVILADTAERAEEIDEKRAQEARKKAEESLKNLRQSDSKRFANISSMIAKELARTRAVIRWKKLKR